MAINVADVSFDHDARLTIDGWPLSCTSRQVSPYVTAIAQVTHQSTCGIYGTAHAHTDWVASGSSVAPDAGGAFTIAAPGDALTLTIASNYADRLQTQVPAETAPEGVPGAYIKRRADVFAASEDPEGVYCWLGWRYLYVTFTAPSATTVTLTLTYRGPGTYNDNHLSDSTRQTEFTYTPGTQTTHTVEVTVPSGAQAACFDLRPDVALHQVETIELAFGAAGAWTLAEPTIKLDDGDLQQQRSAVTSHTDLKVFEHYAYAEGGFSATVDGQHVDCIEWPDHESANTIERTGGNFSKIIGAESGIDSTGAWPLSTALVYVRDCCDAWQTSYNTTADAAAFVDEDDERLITPSVTDLRTVVSADEGALDVAVRVGEWTCATGLVYDWYVEHFTEGQAQGWMEDPDGTVVRDGGDNFNLYRREYEDEGDPWANVEALTSGAHGMWRSDSHEVVLVYDGDTATLYEYGVTGDGEVVSLGRFAAREWAHEDVVALALWDPMLDQATEGTLWRAAESSGVIYVHRACTGRDAVSWQQVTRPFGTSAERSHSSIACHGDGSLLVAATYDGDLVIARSRNCGSTWEAVDLPHLGTGIENGTIAYRDGEVVACGHDGSKVVFRRSSLTDLEAEQLTATATELTVLTVAGTPRSNLVDAGHAVYVAVGEGGNLRTFRLLSMAAGFEEVS